MVTTIVRFCLETRETDGAYRHPSIVTMYNLPDHSYYTWEALAAYIPGVKSNGTSARRRWDLVVSQPAGPYSGRRGGGH